ncbi:hypothetical protein E4U33_006346 [Claviceps sp. LM78 group G4]|nr:hypothetical protein E4U33_006346 [Claviceps sp. LM78 group G4]
MDHKLWIDAIRQSPTADCLTRFLERTEEMGVRQSANLGNLSATGNLLATAINQVDDKDLWKQVKKFIALEANSSEHRQHVDSLMKEELGQIHVDIPQLLQRLFPRSIDGLSRTSKVFFKECKRGRTLRYRVDTWTDWPASPVEKKVFRWLKRICKKLEKFARRSWRDIPHRRRLLGNRYETIDDWSVAQKRLDVGLVDASFPRRGPKDGKHPWPQMLVP